MQYYMSGPPMNPLTRILAALVGVLALVGAFFFGIFIFAAAVVLGLVAWLALWLRMWWLRRKLAGAGQGWDSDKGHGPHREKRHEPPVQGDVIDAEYEVISRGQDDRKNDA